MGYIDQADTVAWVSLGVSAHGAMPSRKFWTSDGFWRNTTCCKCSRSGR